MARIELAEALKLPIDAITQTFLVVGKRGSGKSNTATRLVEQFIRATLPVVVLDVTDTWWGLKADRAGGRGLDVYVFGGRKADLPLEAGGGALIAEVLCEHRLSMVLSVKHLSGRQRSAFMVAFATTLFQKWGGGPLHVVLEEAHELAPQIGARGGGEDGEAAMLGAFKRLWKLGRSSGIGGTAVTQRPASLSKDITTQSEILIAHRTIGPQDVKAIGEWVKYHGEQAELLKDLPSLPTGEAFVWAPEFPEGKPLGLRRISIHQRDTFDSASTPKVGERLVEPKELAPVDLERLRTKMAATIEKAKADDPKALRARIVELERTARSAGKQSVDPGPSRQVKTVEVLTDADRRVLADLAAAMHDAAATFTGEDAGSVAELQRRAEKDLADLLVEFRASLTDVIVKRHEAFAARLERASFNRIMEKLDRFAASSTSIRLASERQATSTTRTLAASYQLRISPSHSPGLAVPGPTRDAVTTMARHIVNGQGPGDPSVGKSGLRRMLIALAQRPQGLTRRQLGLRARVSAKGGSFDTYLSKARVNGWLTSEGDRVRITPAGLEALGTYEPLPSGQALLAHYVGEFGASGAARMLTAIAGAWPGSITRAALSVAANVSDRGGSFDTYLSRLRTLELVEGSSELRASDELFDGDR